MPATLENLTTRLSLTDNLVLRFDWIDTQKDSGRRDIRIDVKAAWADIQGLWATGVWPSDVPRWVRDICAHLDGGPQVTYAIKVFCEKFTEAVLTPPS